MSNALSLNAYIFGILNYLLLCFSLEEEVKQVSKRCEELEVEVLALLNTNQKLKLELAQESSSPPVHHLGEKSDVETELAAKKAEVVRKLNNFCFSPFVFYVIFFKPFLMP